MNKLKIAIQALRDYLGSDKQGLDYLGVLTKVANEQRTRCATLQTTNAELVTNDKKLRGELDAVQMELLAVKAERDRERSKRESAEQRERTIAAQLAATQHTTDPDDDDVSDTADESKMSLRVKLVRQLLKRVKKRHKWIPGTSADARVIYVEDFIAKFSSDEFMTLGMVTALCAFVGYGPEVASEKPMFKEEGWTEEDHHKFYNWFESRIHYDKLGDKCILPTLAPFSLMPGDPNPMKN